MKVKVLAVLIAISAVFIGAVLWRTDSFVYQDRMSWVEAQNRTQLGSMSHALTVELKSLQRIMSTFTADNFKKEQFNWASVSPFYAAVSFNLVDGDFDPQVLLLKDNSRAVSWTKEFIKSSFGKFEKNKNLRFFVAPFQDSNRGRYVGVAFVEGSKAYALVGNGEIFQSLIDAQKGSLSSFSIVNTVAKVVGHSTPEYLGTVMKDNPFFADARKSSSSHGSGTYKLANGQELFGMFEQIPQSNLMVISSAPVSETMQGRYGLWWQFLLLGCGLVLVGSAGLIWIVSPAEKKIEALENQLIVAKQVSLEVPVPTKTVTTDAKTLEAEKSSTSMRVASALAHEMRGPLISILGYSQVILSKNPEKEVVDSADSILRETRAARSVLDKVLLYAGEEVKEKYTMKIEGPLARALKSLEFVFLNKGVKLHKTFESVTPIDLNVDALSNAFEHILTNSVEAMERMNGKEIRLQLTEDDQNIKLIIEDTGEGIEANNIDKIFDPFFTTRTFQNHMGLGLSVALGVLKEHGAKVTVTSERARGTKFQILFNKTEVVQEVHVPLAPKFVKEQLVVADQQLPQLKDIKVLAAPPEPDDSEEVDEYQSVSHFRLPSTMEEISQDTIYPISKDKLDVTESKEKELTKTNLNKQPATQNLEEGRAVAIPSPLDVNIENLFELPSAQEVIAEAKNTKPVRPLPPAGATLNAGLAEDDIDSFNKIVGPRGLSVNKVSKLDEYHVEIRRPGKRT